MGDVVNLNKVRKDAQKAKLAQQAKENREKHGLPRLAKLLAEKQKLIDKQRLDGLQRDKPKP